MPTRKPVLRRRRRDRWIGSSESQNLIDETGRAYGIAHKQGGALRASSEVLDRRDEVSSRSSARRRLQDLPQ